MTRFPSVHHPGRASAAVVLARAQTRPVALALVAVMVLVTAAALKGQPILGTAVWAGAAAYAGAALWAWFDLRRRPAELALEGGRGTLRSVWDVAFRRSGDQPLAPVVAPRKVDGALLVGFGPTAVALRPDDWPDFDALRGALDHAAEEAYEGLVAEGLPALTGP